MRYGVRIAYLAAIGSAMLLEPTIAAPKQIQILNDSDFAMVALQARPAKAKSWPYDLLGKYSLGVGRSQVVPLPDQACVYDFLATFDDGHKSLKPAMNVCKVRMVSFSGR